MSKSVFTILFDTKRGHRRVRGHVYRKGVLERMCGGDILLFMRGIRSSGGIGVTLQRSCSGNQGSYSRGSIRAGGLQHGGKIDSIKVRRRITFQISKRSLY